MVRMTPSRAAPLAIMRRADASWLRAASAIDDAPGELGASGQAIRAGQLETKSFVTHRFELADIVHAYDVFADAAGSGALKVALHS